MKGLCRIYYFKANEPVSTHEGPNKVRMLGTNASWTEIDSREYHVKLKNLCAARNARGELAYAVLTSECFEGDYNPDGTERTIDDVVRSLLGATYPPGLYVNF